MNTLTAAVLTEIDKDIFREILPKTLNIKWILHQDNLPAKTAWPASEFEAKDTILVLEHLPYSHDVALVTSIYFHMQIGTAGQYFET